MRVVCVAAARPNFMKVKPVLDALERQGAETVLVHTGQHYDESMNEVFFRDLGLRQPDRHLGTGSGSHAEQTARVMTAFEPVLDELSAQLDETLHMGYLDGDQIVYVAKREASHQLRLVSAVGVRLPAASTALGKALLAERPPSEVEALLPGRITGRTQHTITSRRRLVESFDDIRACGYAVDNEESTPGVRCFAVTVGPRNPSDYAISCSVPTVRLDAKREHQIIAALLRARERMAGRFIPPALMT